MEGHECLVETMNGLAGHELFISKSQSVFRVFSFVIGSISASYYHTPLNKVSAIVSLFLSLSRPLARSLIISFFLSSSQLVFILSFWGFLSITHIRTRTRIRS